MGPIKTLMSSAMPSLTRMNVLSPLKAMLQLLDPHTNLVMKQGDLHPLPGIKECVATWFS
jgi:hypothetical protein